MGVKKVLMISNKIALPNLFTGGMRKYEIARVLARRYGYKSYLEICTPSTGGTFSRVDRKLFSRRTRLMYRCPLNFSDGERIDFSTEAASGEELFNQLLQSGERFDLVFIDPWHSYVDSLRDITFGLRFVKDDGVVLIHDCSPPNAGCAAPEYRPGEWCGLTFAAYLDVVLFTSGLHYVTVDTDYGCGVIAKDNRLDGLCRSQPDASLVSRWRALDITQKYAFLDQNRSQLLHLISTDDFRQRFGAGRPQASGRVRRLLRAFMLDICRWERYSKNGRGTVGGT
jgi:hypothetical protein